MWRDRFLGGMSPLVLFAPDDGSGSGAGAGERAGDSGGAAGGGGSSAGAAGAGAAGAGAGSGAAAGADGRAGGGSDGGGSGAGQGAGAGAAGADASKTLAGGTDSAAAAAEAAARAATAGAQSAKFPEDWRQQLAGADKAALKDLEKYTDPAAIYKSLRSLQADISSGKLKAPPAALPANATDEQKLEWRKANGLPENPDGYVGALKLGDGVVLGEADKPLISNFAGLATEKGWSQDQFNDAVSWFYDMQGVVEQQQSENDGKTRIASEVALRGEWQGAEYTVNMNAMNTVLQSMPEDFRVAVLTARTADGELLGNTAGFIKWAAAFARENNPTATIIVPSGGDAMKTVQTEIKALEDLMYLPSGQPNTAYWKDEGKQARYRELLDTQQKMTARGQKAAA